MDMYKFEIEKAVPAIGTADLSNKENMTSLLDSRIKALDELASTLTQQRDFLIQELRAANALREVYKKM